MSEVNAKLRKQVQRRKNKLNEERSSWVSHWKECSNVILPRRGRFLFTDHNRGGAVNNFIVDNTPTMALRTLGAGLMSGITSPARTWFKLGTRQPQTMAIVGVKEWLDGCETLIREIYNRSNMYQSLHSLYEELGCFGTGAMLILPDYDNVIHCETLTAGQYWIATDTKGRVNTLYRTVPMTTSQIVDEFAPLEGAKGVRNWSNIPSQLKEMYNRDDLDTVHKVIHAIEPNRDYRPSPEPKFSQDKAFRSVWFIEGMDSETVLRHAGFDYFPAVCPRWTVTPGDVYGRSCGMDALEDARMLQDQQRVKQRAIEKMVDPPLNAPGGLMVNDLPGGLNFYDASSPAQNRVEPVYQVQPRLVELVQDMEEVQQRIKTAFYYDLWMMIAEIDRTGITATEIEARREEKMLMLGPVLEQLHHELLDPIIDITFSYCVEAELIPPPPDSVSGERIDVQYTSVLAQAQRATETNSIRSATEFVMGVSQAYPEAGDLFNAERTVRRYAAAIGSPVEILNNEEETQAIRQRREEQQMQMQSMQMTSQAAVDAKNLSQADMSGDNALSEVANALGDQL